MTRQPSTRTALLCEDCGHHLHRPNPGICQWYDCGCPAVSTRRDPGQYHRDRVEREKADPEFRAEYDLARTAAPRTTAGRNLLATAYLAGDAASEGVSLLDAILAIEAEAAAPAGLDVEALANAYKRLASQRHSLSEQPVHMEHVFSECPHPDCLAARAAGW